MFKKLKYFIGYRKWLSNAQIGAIEYFGLGWRRMTNKERTEATENANTIFNYMREHPDTSLQDILGMSDYDMFCIQHYGMIKAQRNETGKVYRLQDVLNKIAANNKESGGIK